MYTYKKQTNNESTYRNSVDNIRQTFSLNNEIWEEYYFAAFLYKI